MGAGLKAQAPVGLALLSPTAIAASGYTSKAGPHGGAPSLSSVQGPANLGSLRRWEPKGARRKGLHAAPSAVQPAGGTGAGRPEASLKSEKRSRLGERQGYREGAGRGRGRATGR